MEQPILSVENLTVELPSGRGTAKILHGISFDVKAGEIVGLVGESGSGKSVTALALLQLLPGGAKAITGGSIRLCNQELTSIKPKEFEQLRGKDLSMIFQEPMTSLNPVFTIGRQLVDVILAHRPITKIEATGHALIMLEQVRITDPERVFGSYPHELSGGMRQRVMIAAALSCSPSLLIADEPTTALDVTIQAQILDLLRDITKLTGTSVLFITHDLGVVSRLCSRVAVMYAGEIVEMGKVQQLLSSPRHPYSKALLAAIPCFAGNSQKLVPIPGTVPDVRQTLAGCHFHSRCPKRRNICFEQKPKCLSITPEHQVRCWYNAGEEL